jgi:hypothetical protein
MPVSAVIDARFRVRYFEKLEKIALSYFVSEKKIVVSGKYILAAGDEDLFVNGAGIEDLGGARDFFPYFFRIIIPVGVYSEAGNRAFPKPFAE